MELKDLLRIMVEQEGSDIFLTTGAPPAMKAHGKLVPMTNKSLSPGITKKIADSIMDEKQKKEFEQNFEMNMAIVEPGVGRFRINIFIQRTEVAIVARHIKTDIPNYKDLGLPAILPELMMKKNGIILFVGGTGSGKSTSLASLIDYRNQNSDGHIITIEDPIEFVHQHKKSIINQREVGVDTHSYEEALKNTLRQAPDVILIGEIRTRETMEHALAFAETGHLCLSTLHANNANQALDRIINFFPEERHKQLFLDLSLNLRAFISQRLIPNIEGTRTAAVEVLLATPRVADLINHGKIHEIKEVMEKGESDGMITFDSALFQLYQTGKITMDEALNYSDSKNNLRLKISLSESKYSSPDEAEKSSTEGELKLDSGSSGLSLL